MYYSKIGDIQKKVFLIIIFLIAAAAIFSYLKREKNDTRPDSEETQGTEWMLTYKKLKSKADSAKVYCVAKNMNTNYCLLVDFSRHSGYNRLFVWNLKTDTIAFAGLCCHGYGQNSTTSKPVFSNEPESYCSSIGKYKIGISSYSKWGINIHYKLYGLEPTNSNAFKRTIVLHSYSLVPNSEIYPMPLPLGFSQGCPVVSNDIMTKLDSLLKKKNRLPMMLWVYN